VKNIVIPKGEGNKGVNADKPSVIEFLKKYKIENDMNDLKKTFVDKILSTYEAYFLFFFFFLFFFSPPKLGNINEINMFVETLQLQDIQINLNYPLEMNFNSM